MTSAKPLKIYLQKQFVQKSLNDEIDNLISLYSSYDFDTELISVISLSISPDDNVSEFKKMIIPILFPHGVPENTEIVLIFRMHVPSRKPIQPGGLGIMGEPSAPFTAVVSSGDFPFSKTIDSFKDRLTPDGEWGRFFNDFVEDDYVHCFVVDKSTISHLIG